MNLVIRYEKILTFPNTYFYYTVQYYKQQSATTKRSTEKFTVATKNSRKCYCEYILSTEKSVEWHAKGRRSPIATHPIHNKHVTYYRTTKCSYYKTTTCLLHVVAIRHTKPCQRVDKKCALTAHIMRDKREKIIILYVVGDKKTANTPLYLNHSAIKKLVLMRWVFLMFHDSRFLIHVTFATFIFIILFLFRLSFAHCLQSTLTSVVTFLFYYRMFI